MPGPDGDLPRITFTFDDRPVEASPSDTVTSALIAADVLATSRSPKYRRARGAYCMTGDCGTCLVRIDGRPNQRACLTHVRAEMRVASQNTLRPDALDPTRLVDAVFRRGFDHHHLMVKPRIVNQAMQTFARNLTGLGSIPDEGVDVSSGHLHRTPTVLVIGGGAAGRGVASTLRSAGVDRVVVDRFDPRLGSVVPGVAQSDFPPADATEFGVSVFGAYPGERWIAASHASSTAALHTFAPTHVVVCVGAREPMLPLDGCDLPGIVAARGLLRTVLAAGWKPEGVVAVVGDGDRATTYAEALGATAVVPTESVRGFTGRGRVRAIRTASGTIKVDLVALAPTPAPAHELPVQLGAAVRFDGDGFAVQRDVDGRCARFEASDVWAAGEVCGTMSAEAAHADGVRVAGHLIESLATARSGGDE